MHAVPCAARQALASLGAVSSRSRGAAMTPAEARGSAPAWEGGAVFPCGFGPGGLWAGSPGVLTNADGVLGRPHLAVVLAVTEKCSEPSPLPQTGMRS